MSLSHGAIAELAISDSGPAAEQPVVQAPITTTAEVPPTVDVVMVRTNAPQVPQLTAEGRAGDRLGQQGAVRDAPWRVPLGGAYDYVSPYSLRRMTDLRRWLDE